MLSPSILQSADDLLVPIACYDSSYRKKAQEIARDEGHNVLREI